MPLLTVPVRVRLPFFAVAVRHRDVQRERVVRRRGQRRVVPVVAGRQHDLKVILHALHAGHTSRRRGRLHVLRVVRHRAVKRYFPVQVLHRDIQRVDERIVVELVFH
jgi:hypothetical protein